jgi:hypothetical protein
MWKEVEVLINKLQNKNISIVKDDEL